MHCPACGSEDIALVRRHTVAEASEFFVPHVRDPSRHRRMCDHLASLWPDGGVHVRGCSACGFGFADPFVAGDAEFYRLAHDGASDYWSERWEFAAAAEAIRAHGDGVRLLEIGAGDGAFLDQLPAGSAGAVVAAEFDEGAVRRLCEKGYDALHGSIAAVRERGDEPFDVVCAFQTLEHLADLEAFFADVQALLRPGGTFLVSVPSADATRVQEQLTGLWDMPPNHVGRWTPEALRRFSTPHGFAVRDVRFERLDRRAVAQQYAAWAVNARAMRPRRPEHRLNAIRSRALRRAAKGGLAAAQLPRLLAARRRFVPLTFFAELRQQDVAR